MTWNREEVLFAISKVEVVGCSEKSVNNYHNAPRHIPEGNGLNIHYSECLTWKLIQKFPKSSLGQERASSTTFCR